jgi:pyruvate/oxaloacetate carboxyltransferase
LGRLTDVLAEIPRVRADLGYPPLVTPTSQIVGIQAVVNVLTGTRYGQVTQEVRDYVRGMYGTPPGPVDADLRRRVLERDAPLKGRPADHLGPEFSKAVAEVRQFVPAADDAEAISYALFPLVYRSYRQSLDQGLNPEILNALALGVVAAFRSPPPSPPSSVNREPSAGISAWAYDGRVRLQSQRRWATERSVARRR